MLLYNVFSQFYSVYYPYDFVLRTKWNCDEEFLDSRSRVGSFKDRVGGEKERYINWKSKFLFSFFSFLSIYCISIVRDN